MAEPLGLRHAAITWLEQRSFDRQIPLTRDDIAEFRWEGGPFRLIPSMQGIWKPRGFEATLSIVTTYRAPGQKRPYEDEVGADGLIRYKWRGDNPQHAENVGLRRAMQLRLPIIWFIGIGGKPPEYQVVAPVYLLAEEPEHQQFVMAPVADEDFAVEEFDEGLAVPALKRYLMRQTKVRLHQPVFRSTVLLAYENHCAVCNLAHPELLDAAHIVGDNHELGTPTVGNGMALCKIHHAAFDRRFLGIRPTARTPVVEIRQDLLDEVDGPMLRHGLQDLHGKPLMMVPKARRDRPDNEKLAWAYERFLTATVADVA
ncbi:HNH endonuclease [Micrococcus sp.]|uniref:HNH endonuclease n=1 Tax=Micrococcus sp. TaxID=1271 RepID=UPI002A9196E3|nr:HNH endonuclease [Micrococcus sp.]MDY6054966.1 HNH endonuclease [Micrococcus sp.]